MLFNKAVKERSTEQAINEETLEAVAAIVEGVKVGLGLGAAVCTVMLCVWAFGKVFGVTSGDDMPVDVPVK